MLTTGALRIRTLILIQAQVLPSVFLGLWFFFKPLEISCHKGGGISSPFKACKEKYVKNFILLRKLCHEFHTN